jgi:hypothetical protein
MADVAAAVRAQLARQVAHWTAVTDRLQDPEEIASEASWSYLERYLGLTLRRNLSGSVDRLQRQAAILKAAFEAAESPGDLEAVQRRLLDFRCKYLRTETTLEFFAEAINTRTSPTVRAYLRACDSLAHRSMAAVLDQLEKPAPVALVYVDKGLGASILKAGLRLWDGTENPVAAIKITRQNLYRPTSLIHETGHQVAHIAGWNEELAAALDAEVSTGSSAVADMWAGWASEIAADAHAFVHTGYAAVAALHDVLAGEDSQIFRYVAGDPHPTGYIRVLLGVEMCRQFYGAGPWDDLELAWTHQHSVESARGGLRELLQRSTPMLPRIVNIILRRPMKAFLGRSLSSLINPERVKPSTLEALDRQLGAALYTSTHWVWTESLRLLALSGLRLATQPLRSAEFLKQQESWMFRLGGALQAA